MRWTVNDKQVFVEGDAPEFASSVNSVSDPSKIKGLVSTSIEIVNTPEAARVLGTEHMHDLPSSERPLLRVGDGSVSIFQSPVIQEEHTRNRIRCIAVGGNATWFDYAKATRIRDADFGLSDLVASAMQIATWTDEDSILHFPLIDFGALEARSSTYDVQPVQLRPAVRVHRIISDLLALEGWQVVPRGELESLWPKLIVIDPQAKPTLETPNPYTYSTIPPSTPNPTGFYFVPSADGLLDVVLTDMTFAVDPFDSEFDGVQFRVVLYDFTAQEVLDYYDPVCPYFGETGYGDFEINHTFSAIPVLSGHDIGITIQALGLEDQERTVSVGAGVGLRTIAFDRDSGAQTLTLTSIVTTTFELTDFTATKDYAAGQRLNIARCAPDMTLGDLISNVTNALCLAWTTNVESKTIEVWFDREFFRLPSKSITTRDWTARMDHTNPPTKRRPATPSALVLKWADDDEDRFLRRYRFQSGKTFGRADLAFPMAYGNEQEISLRFAPSVMGVLFGTVTAPIARDVESNVQEDAFDRVPRLLIADGVASGNWRFDGVDRTTYPRVYFGASDALTPLPFDNAVIAGESLPISIESNWKRRIDEYRTPRYLEAHFTIHDHEVQDFDHGMPTLVDDGSGPRWYYVQEIMAHRFGLGAPTRCRLVEIPGADVQASEVVNPRITYPSQPFACVGRGYASLVCDSSPAPHVFTSTGYLAMRNASSGLVEVFGTGGAGEFQPNPSAGGTYCMWASDSLGNPAGTVTQLRVGDDSGPITSMDLQGWTALTVIDCDEALNLAALTLGSKPVLTTLTASYTVLEELDLSGCSVLTDFVANNVEELETITPPPNVTLELVNVSFCGLDSASVNGLALKCNPAVAGSFDSGSGTNGPPTGAGAAYLATLLATPLTITGAGEAAVNDTYTLNGTILGHDAYLSGGGIAIYFAGFGGWIITDEVNTYYTTETPDDPWDVVTWQTDGGFAAPAPTLTAPSDGLWTVNTN